MTCKICAAPSDGFLCSRRPAGREDPGGHTEQLERTLAELPWYLDQLNVTIAQQAKTYKRAGVASQAEAAAASVEMAMIPARLRSQYALSAMQPTDNAVNFDAADLRRDVVDELLRLACLVGANEVSSRHVTGWLLSHLDDIRLSLDADEVYDRVRSCQRRIEKAIDRSPSLVWRGPCEARLPDDVNTVERDGTIYIDRTVIRYCTHDLYAPRGAKTITCDGWTPRRGSWRPGPGAGDKPCGTAHTLDDRRKWLLRSLTDDIAPMTEWEAALPGLLPDLQWPVSRTWERWARQLENRGTRTAPKFRGGDVVEKCEKEQARITGNRERVSRKKAS